MEPDWSALAMSEDWKALWRCKRLTDARSARVQRLLRPGGTVDPEEIGRIRGFLEALEFVEALPEQEHRRKQHEQEQERFERRDPRRSAWLSAVSGGGDPSHLVLTK